ncbi:GNAT family N-acetyltransferase [Epibacterium sp. SM1969]|uniref:GNAT family N-acetyltransferase n=1 Tax=Tritonibacter aquimaris TaxID=2663379 RepID=A0A844AJZ8_9RHOB|nr:GNAT family N-acetyltransferase [Tritonibacter aquimaris]MQY41239.1 GNAT family N-acetyltransferase [Tritonibacter aquimaris]
MSAALQLAKPEHLEKLAALAAAFREERGEEVHEDGLNAALMPLLDGNPYGAAYLIGPARAAIGYLVLGFTWDMERGGLQGLLQEIYIRPPVRGRGIATEALLQLIKTMSGAGLLDIQVKLADEGAAGLFQRVRFAPVETPISLIRPLV